MVPGRGVVGHYIDRCIMPSLPIAIIEYDMIATYTYYYYVDNGIDNIDPVTGIGNLSHDMDIARHIRVAVVSQKKPQKFQKWPKIHTFS